MRRCGTIILVAALLLYAGSYVAVRRAHWVIHYCGYYTDGDRRVVAGHRVAAGDPGPMGNPAFALAHHAFTPLRWAETAYWHIRRPPGSAWEQRCSAEQCAAIFTW